MSPCEKAAVRALEQPAGPQFAAFAAGECAGQFVTKAPPSNVQKQRVATGCRLFAARLSQAHNHGAVNVHSFCAALSAPPPRKSHTHGETHHATAALQVPSSSKKIGVTEALSSHTAHETHATAVTQLRVQKLVSLKEPVVAAKATRASNVAHSAARKPFVATDTKPVLKAHSDQVAVPQIHKVALAEQKKNEYVGGRQSKQALASIKHVAKIASKPTDSTVVPEENTPKASVNPIGRKSPTKVQNAKSAGPKVHKAGSASKPLGTKTESKPRSAAAISKPSKTLLTRKPGTALDSKSRIPAVARTLASHTKMVETKGKNTAHVASRSIPVEKPSESTLKKATVANALKDPKAPSKALGAAPAAGEDTEHFLESFLDRYGPTPATHHASASHSHAPPKAQHAKVAVSTTAGVKDDKDTEQFLTSFLEQYDETRPPKGGAHKGWHENGVSPVHIVQHHSLSAASSSPGQKPHHLIASFMNTGSHTEDLDGAPPSPGAPAGDDDEMSALISTAAGSDASATELTPFKTAAKAPEPASPMLPDQTGGPPPSSAGGDDIAALISGALQPAASTAPTTPASGAESTAAASSTKAAAPPSGGDIDDAAAAFLATAKQGFFF